MSKQPLPLYKEIEGPLDIPYQHKPEDFGKIVNNIMVTGNYGTVPASFILYILPMIANDALHEIWSDLLKHGEYYRPDYLMAIVLHSLHLNINRLATSIHWAIIGENPTLDISESEDLLTRLMSEAVITEEDFKVVYPPHSKTYTKR